jgi:4-hydroxy-tetrahydrodipicolinate reductase
MNEPIPVAVLGVAGRMGQRLAGLVLDSDDLALVAGLERPGHAALGHDVGELLGRPRTTVIVSSDLDAEVSRARVVIDFTTPASTLAAAAACAARNTAMVVGTTGFTDAERAEFQRRVAGLACVFSPSYSTAMNVLFQLVEQAARALGDGYDIEVVEAHHRHKVDAPSGTALRLAERAAQGRGLDPTAATVHGRQGIVGPRPPAQIGMHAIRAGDLVGDHTVMFAALGECLELHHRATNRDAFAVGALRAVRFVAPAAPGMYSMRDVLGLA